MCKKCNDTKTTWVPCPLCSDTTDIWTRQAIELGMKCPECQMCGGNGKVPEVCPDCNPEKSELPVELL